MRFVSYRRRNGLKTSTTLWHGEGARHFIQGFTWRVVETTSQPFIDSQLFKRKGLNVSESSSVCGGKTGRTVCKK